MEFWYMKNKEEEGTEAPARIQIQSLNTISKDISNNISILMVFLKSLINKSGENINTYFRQSECSIQPAHRPHRLDNLKYTYLLVDSPK